MRLVEMYVCMMMNVVKIYEKNILSVLITVGTYINKRKLDAHDFL